MAKTKSSNSSKVSLKAIIDTVKVTNKSNALKLRGFRKQNKMTQAEIGASIGRNSRTISQYETEYRAIPDKIIAQLNAKYSLDLKPVVMYDWDIKTGKCTIVKKSTKKSSKVSSKSTKSTKRTYSKRAAGSKPTRVSRSASASVESKFKSYVFNYGKVADFATRYHMSTAGVYRIINSVGEHYLSFSTLSKLAKDTDLNKLFK